MKRLGDLLNRVLVVGLVAVAVAVFLVGREAVGRAADYREMTAPKSLHQLTLETRAEPEGRGGVLLFGAALGVAALAYAGVVAFGFPAGREFGRSLARRRKRARPAPPAGSGPAPLPLAPRMRVLPPAETVRSLPPGYEEGRYE
jgi:hypothetical protein